MAKNSPVQNTASEDKTILMTGGHAVTTAIAVIEEIQKHSPKWQISWVGSKYAFEGSRLPSIESQVFDKTEIKFIPITTGKLQTKFTRYSVTSLLKIPIGFVSAFKILIQEKPDLIISFGGFAGFPVVFVGRLLNIPIIIHEQTAAAGRANKLSAKFATKILLARVSSKKHFNKDKEIVVIGNPIGSRFRKLKKSKTKNNPPIILVTGGSRGSKILNETVVASLQKLVKDFKIVHIAGVLDKDIKFTHVNYKLYPRVSPEKMAKLMDGVDIVIARSGANTVAEIMHLGIPGVFVPLPFTYEDEQYKNALLAKNSGLSRIILQKNLSSKSLIKEIKDVNSNWDKIIKNYKPPFSDIEAAHKFYSEIINTLK